MNYSVCRAYKGIGIGLGMTVAAVFICLLYSCWRNRRRREGECTEIISQTDCRDQ